MHSTIKQSASLAARGLNGGSQIGVSVGMSVGVALMGFNVTASTADLVIHLSNVNFLYKTLFAKLISVLDLRPDLIQNAMTSFKPCF